MGRLNVSDYCCNPLDSGKKRLDSEYTLKVKPVGCPDRCIFVYMCECTSKIIDQSGIAGSEGI